jgi:DNA-binding response OmpR family regulator
LLSEAMHDSAALPLPLRVRGYTGPRVKVLLVDDDASHLDIVRNLLQPLDFQIFMASTAQDGLQLARECQPDLALLDISMSDMTGWQLARSLREEASLSALRIVMVSANSHEYTQAREDKPHDAFVMKPIDFRALLECIRSVLRLTWVYDAADELASAQYEHTLQFPDAARHHLDDLLQLGRIGHVRGIQAKLQQMESEDAASIATVTRLRALVVNFDLKRYMTLLEAARHGG